MVKFKEQPRRHILPQGAEQVSGYWVPALTLLKIPQTNSWIINNNSVHLREVLLIIFENKIFI